MSKKIALSIAEPCHENWEKMSPDAKGKFCGSCQKQVIDFSSMSDTQVAQFFKKPSTGSVCGRFMTDQLNREIEIPKKRIPWAKHFFTLLLPAFLISKASAQNSKMGKVIPVEKDTTRTPMTSEFRTLGMVAPQNIQPFLGDTTVCTTEVITKNLKGKIVDEVGNVIPFASIQVGKTLHTYIADEKGEFVINTELLGNNKSLLISSVGFESKEVIIKDATNFLKVELTMMLMGDVTISSTQSFVKGEIIAGGINVERIDTNTDEIVTRDIEVPASQNKFFIYPNPVLSGGNASLGIAMMEEGYYVVNFLSLSGELLQQKEIWIDGKVKVLNIDVPKVAAGSYFLVLTNKKTSKKMTEKIIIQ